MSNEIVTMLGVGATLLASGASFALFMFRQFVRLEGRMGGIEGRFDRLESRFVRLEEKVDDLARDHQSLARELSEFRGEMRGRLGDLTVGSGAG